MKSGGKDALIGLVHATWKGSEQWIGNMELTRTTVRRKPATGSQNPPCSLLYCLFSFLLRNLAPGPRGEIGSVSCLRDNSFLPRTLPQEGSKLGLPLRLPWPLAKGEVLPPT